MNNTRMPHNTGSRAASRRSFVSAGLMSAFGLSYADEVQAQSVSTHRSVERVVSIFLAGGLSQLESFDPKPDASQAIRGPSGAISTATPGVFFSEWMPRLAKRSKQFAVLRGVSHNVDFHIQGETLLMTGIRDARSETPSLGSVVSRFGPDSGDVPAYAAVPSLPPNAGELGQSHEPFNAMGDSARLLQLGPDLASSASKEEFNRRVDLLKRLNVDSRVQRSDSATWARRDAYAQAVRDLTSPRLRSLSNTDQESQSVRDAYGETEAGRFLLTTRRLLETGIRFVTVRLAGWDTHANHFAELKTLVPPVDQAFAAFLDDLTSRDLLKSTLVIVSTEFGRTPAINSMAGRDHSPQAFSCLMAGGRIKGGVVMGATDQIAGEVTEGLCTPQDLAATVLSEVGIPPLRTFVPPTGRVVLPEGRLLTELF